ncbi:O-methyltransferase, family 3 [Candidatus Zixiibacteriota bacterium]|nr:O-methyltransferase, family 3 [candidate division Zixibacteria bacterium]
MNITHPKIEAYISGIIPPRDKIQQEMERYARKISFPIIGPAVGRFLRQLALVSGAERILELGSGFGYSAYWFAGGMRPRGKIICTDLSEDNRARAIGFFKRGGYGRMLEYYVGDALETARGLRGRFDIILNDIDKADYPSALELGISKLRRGGIFITDNVLWSGEILKKRKSAESEAILEFNHRLFSSKGIFSSIIPIRDGLSLAVKTD